MLTSLLDHSQQVGVSLGGSQKSEPGYLLLAGLASSADLGVGLRCGWGVLAAGDPREVTAGDPGGSGYGALALAGSLDKTLEQITVLAGHNSIITDY